MTASDWVTVFGGITAAATVAVPVVVAVMAARFNQQVKKWEANQWRNQELIKARLEYYRVLVPNLNDLMCYFTFIGRWKEFTPPDVIALKRTLDRDFYCAAPLFEEDVKLAYQQLMAECFEMFGGWGADAHLRTTFGRRKPAMGDRWDPLWEKTFIFGPGDQSHEHDYPSGPRLRYDTLVHRLVRDIELVTSVR